MALISELSATAFKRVRRSCAAAVLLDRDGVIIENRSDYVKTLGEVAFLPGAIQAMVDLGSSDYVIVLVTNQSAVGRGIMSLDAATTLNRRIIDQIEEAGGRIDGWYMCPHGPDDDCECRKPKAGMLLAACTEFGLNTSESWMIGDAVTDMEAARTAGVQPILVQTGRGADQLAAVDTDVLVLPDLAWAVRRILPGVHR